MSRKSKMNLNYLDLLINWGKNVKLTFFKNHNKIKNSLLFYVCYIPTKKEKKKKDAWFQEKTKSKRWKKYCFE